MSLNIKNEAVHELVRKASALTGASQTSVVEIALRRYLEVLDREMAAEEKDKRLFEIFSGIDTRIAADPDRYAITTDVLYDENGLPA